MRAYFIILLLVFSGCRDQGQLVRTFESPDAIHRVEVYAYPESKSSPGDSGQGPGRIILIGKQNKVLNSTNVDMVNVVDKVWWSEGEVVIRGVANWSISQPDKGQPKHGD